MFVQVNPDVSSYTETLSTLKFAERVSGVELGVARTNKEGKDVKELMDQVTRPPPPSLMQHVGILILVFRCAKKPRILYYNSMSNM
jgi:hypothetical protein